jgi:hypothetical protein
MEDDDPEILAAIDRLAKARAASSSIASEVIGCEDSEAVSKRGATGGICKELAVKQSINQQLNCEAKLIGTDGLILESSPDEDSELLPLTTMIAPPNSVKPGHKYSRLDLADIKASKIFNDQPLEYLRETLCSNQTKAQSNQCFLKVVCKNIQKTNVNTEPKVGDDTTCPTSFDKTKELENLLKSETLFTLNIAPRYNILEQEPFSCGHKRASNLRKTTGICFQVKAANPSDGQNPLTGDETLTKESLSCKLVKNQQETEQVVPCPEGLLETLKQLYSGPA